LKVCTKCQVSKSESEFSIQYGKPRSSCKHCRSLYHIKIKGPKKAKQTVEQRRAYYREYMSRPKNRIAQNLRRRVNKAIRGKPGSAVKDLGCSVPELIKYIEYKFKIGMSWDNYGMKGWHVDHIKPLVLFDLYDIAEFRKACHFTNLQPLWATENRKKRCKHEL
jgi:hypothetical protein